jgi:hypothetical protein
MELLLIGMALTSSIGLVLGFMLGWSSGVGIRELILEFYFRAESWEEAWQRECGHDRIGAP